MKTKMLACVGMLFLLSGCATTQNAPVSQGLKTGNHTTLNHDRIQRVERAARVLGTDVHWVNPPRTVHRKDG